MYFFLFLLLTGFTLDAAEKAAAEKQELAMNLNLCKLKLGIMLLEEELAQNELEYNMLKLEDRLCREFLCTLSPRETGLPTEKQ